MLPSLRQRLLLATFITLGAAVLWQALPVMTLPSGASGASLYHGQHGAILAVIVLLLAATPMLAGGIAAAAAAHPLSGVFALGAALMVVACAGGSMDGWIRSVQTPQAYRGLLVETVFWTLLLSCFIVACHYTREKLRARLMRHTWLISSTEPGYAAPLWKLNASCWQAGALAAAVGGSVTTLLLRSPDTGQVVGAMLLGFGVGGLAGQMILPRKASPFAILLAPAAVALAAYAFTAWQFHHPDQLMTAWFAQTGAPASPVPYLPSLAMALPVFYFSAGVVGVTLGVGLGQLIQAAQAELVQQPA